MNEVDINTGLLKWVSFTPSILEFLPNGKYLLHRKKRVTPPVASVVLCPPEDQVLFSAVDKMEIQMLDDAIKRKLVELNKTGMKMYLLVHGFVTCRLVVVNHKLPGKRQKETRRSLGRLMAMAYEMILIGETELAESLIPVVHIPNLSTAKSIDQLFQEHNYCKKGFILH